MTQLEAFDTINKLFAGWVAKAAENAATFDEELRVAVAERDGAITDLKDGTVNGRSENSPDNVIARLNDGGWTGRLPRV